MNSMEQFLASLSGNAPEPQRISPDLEIANLRNVFEHLIEGKAGPRFEPGQILRHRFPSLCSSRFGEGQAIFLRYLSKPICGLNYVTSAEELTGFKASREYDCIMGFLEQGADEPIFVTYLQDSREWRAA